MNTASKFLLMGYTQQIQDLVEMGKGSETAVPEEETAVNPPKTEKPEVAEEPKVQIKSHLQVFNNLNGGMRI